MSEFGLKEARIALASLQEYWDRQEALLYHLESERERLTESLRAAIEMHEVELAKIRDGERLWLPHTLHLLAEVRPFLSPSKPRERSNYARALSSIDELLQRRDSLLSGSPQTSKGHPNG